MVPYQTSSIISEFVNSISLPSLGELLVKGLFLDIHVIPL